MPPMLARLLSGVSFLAAIAANLDANARWSEIKTSSGLYLQNAVLPLQPVGQGSDANGHKTS